MCEEEDCDDEEDYDDDDDDDENDVDDVDACCFDEHAVSCTAKNRAEAVKSSCPKRRRTCRGHSGLYSRMCSCC